ncbi:hypothetical protein SAMD00019534_010260 [Acytostelium subglobosum LB1]|uniref:hypothetical protein n=1 Tax=Acytostelium subglobosum LB1 TaxID=1410327 RepID=UPI0006448B7D|nr:hypothetical protein SAMD00019534_010260 [Acytostelium subglobosum LB1]GAM17851.1 hypothetical protein SAMD00019534_010260 [Acytostelium subglobosum LB1]|eukprot:XP_012758447.1 hypothetical protein SAMD00019534_010260 [Acytostelium subglobosum LB1]
MLRLPFKHLTPLLLQQCGNASVSSVAIASLSSSTTLLSSLYRHSNTLQRQQQYIYRSNSTKSSSSSSSSKDEVFIDDHSSSTNRRLNLQRQSSNNNNNNNNSNIKQQVQQIQQVQEEILEETYEQTPSTSSLHPRSATDNEFTKLIDMFQDSMPLAIEQLNNYLYGTKDSIKLEEYMVDEFLHLIKGDPYLSTDLLNTLLQYYIRVDRLEKIKEIIGLYIYGVENADINQTTLDLVYEYSATRQHLVLDSFNTRPEIIQYTLQTCLLAEAGPDGLYIEREYLLHNWDVQSKPLYSPIPLLMVFNELNVLEGTDNSGAAQHIVDFLYNKLRALDSVRVQDIALNDIVGNYLSIGCYNMALRWYAIRIADFRLMPNHHTIGKFIAYQSQSRKSDENLDADPQMAYWLKAKGLYTDNWRLGITQSIQNAFVESQKGVDTNAITASIKDYVSTMDEIDTLLNHHLVAGNAPEVRLMLLETYFKTQRFPSGAMLLEAADLLFKHNPKDYLDNLLLKAPLHFLPLICTPAHFSSILQTDLDQGIRMLSKQQDIFIFSNSAQTWCDIMVGLLNNGGHLSLIGRMIRTLVNTFKTITPKIINDIGMWMYAHNRFDGEVISALEEYSNAYMINPPLIKHLKMSQLAKSRRFKEAHDIFIGMTEKKSRTYQVATDLFLKQCAYSRVVSKRLGVAWSEPTIDQLERFLQISLSFHKTNPAVLAIITGTLLRDNSQPGIGLALVKQNIARDEKSTHADDIFGKLIRSLSNEKEKLDLVTHISQYNLMHNKKTVEHTIKQQRNIKSSAGATGKDKTAAEIEEMDIDSNFLEATDAPNAPKSTASTSSAAKTSQPLSQETLDFIQHHFVEHTIQPQIHTFRVNDQGNRQQQTKPAYESIKSID